MHNLANVHLSDRQQIALSLGLEYIPVPEHNRFWANNELSRSFEDYRRRIRNAYFFSCQPSSDDTYDPFFAVPSIWEVPAAKRNNIIESYLQNVKAHLDTRFEEVSKHPIRVKFNPPWLIPTILDLRDNKEFVITAADKNMGTAVVGTQDYINEALRRLSDVATYQRIDQYNALVIWTGLINLLITHNVVKRNADGTLVYYNKSLAKFLLQSYTDPLTDKMANFYMLMKVHKGIPAGQSIPPGRPIVSSVHSITYFASKFVDHKLQPLFRQIFSFVASSQHLIYLLATCQPFPANCFILCADIESLYPNIPTDEGLQLFRTSVLFYNNLATNKHRLSNADLSLLFDLTDFVLRNNDFSFGDALYHQRNGTAMGTPLAVVYACMVVDHIERQVQATLPQEHLPLFFRRYIDDIFIVTSSREAALAFMQGFNSAVATIRCPEPTISDSEGVMLDLIIFKDPTFAATGKFATSLYQKTQNKYLYLPPSSFHSPHVFSAFVIAEVKRYRLHCSREEDFLAACARYRQRLLERGYNSMQLQSWFATAFATTRQSLLNDLHVRYQHLRMKRSAATPLLFKTIATTHSKAMNFTKRIQPAPQFQEPGNPVDELFRRRGQPLTCYRNAKSIASFVTKSRTSLHGLSVVSQVQFNGT